MAQERHRVVVVGGGFGGLYAIQNMYRADYDITLIDRRNFHLFQPLLYQVATGGLSPANIASPLRSVLKRQKNTRVLLGEVTALDIPNKAVFMGQTRVEYDTLILAAGSMHHYFGKPEWERHAPGLKTIEDATEIRRRVLTAFEQAEREADPVKRNELLTFAIVGGGPTGVEMAGAVAELARYTLRNDFRSIDPVMTRIVLVENSMRVLGTFPESLSHKAEAALGRLKIEIIHGGHVVDIQDHYLEYKKDDEVHRLPTDTVIWAAGVKASPLGQMVATATGAPTDRGGRVLVGPDMTVPNHPEIFIIGDMAHATGKDGETQLPGVAPVAMQQGKYVAKVIQKRLAGRSIDPFRYWDKGNMATIGRAAAVVDLYWLRFSGFIAWMAWLFIHLMFLVQFQNRLLVMSQWFWNYLTRNRSARLITKTFSEQVWEDSTDGPNPQPTMKSDEMVQPTK